MKTYKKIHFIGIGGIGMSALARLLQYEGAEISGSDGAPSDITNDLVAEGIKVYTEQVAENISDEVDCIIYTLAIADDNPEMVRARELEEQLGVSVFTYAQMLGQVSSGKKTIAVSGTHGKTTTTAMINSVLRGAGSDPTMIVGSLIKQKVSEDVNGISEKKTNFIKGTNDIFIAEACEYKKSFLNLNPTILVITNIEEDHLDFYKDLEDIKETFMELAKKVPPAEEGGRIICDFDNENLKEIIAAHSEKVINWREYMNELPKMRAIGEHNRMNGAAALAASVAADSSLNIEGLKKGLAEFSGTWRRLESHGENKNGALIYDDYAHHPTEIKFSLSALKKEFPDKNLVAIFQPHLYSRTKDFFDGFVEVLQIADEVFLLPIYAAREPNDPEISSDKIAEAIPGAKMLQNFDEARSEISSRGVGDVVVTVGAGDIFEVLE